MTTCGAHGTFISVTKRGVSSIGAGAAVVRPAESAPARRYKRWTGCHVETALPWHRLCGRVDLAATEPAPDAQALGIR
jgi:hypothetical protein